MLNYVVQSGQVSMGWLTLAAVGIAVIAYFFGCFNGAVVVSRYILRDDVRNHGSGNAGLTNFYRTFGGPLTAVVILSDVVKAVLAILFGAWIAGAISPDLIVLSKYWAGMFCLLGHMFPITFQFRGGKGILSGGTVALMMDWRVALVVWGGFLILAILTRYVSLGSCWAGLSFPFVTAAVYQDVLITVLSVMVGGLILFQHRGNILRLIKGEESKFSFHKKKETEGASGHGDDGTEECVSPAEETENQQPVEAAVAENMEEDAAEEGAENVAETGVEDTSVKDNSSGVDVEVAEETCEEDAPALQATSGQEVEPSDAQAEQAGQDKAEPGQEEAQAHQEGKK